MATKTKKPGALTLNALRMWLKKQNPNTEYHYQDSRDCLAFRFIQAQGHPVLSVGTTSYTTFTDPADPYGSAVRLDLPAGFDEVSNNGSFENTTYEGALERLEDYMKTHKQKE